MADELHTPPDYCEYSAGACDQSFDGIESGAGIFLYPSQPQHVSEVIDSAVFNLKNREPEHRWRSWRDLATAGQIIFCSICKATRFSEIVVADVTTLNFNLLFEIGFALGLERPVVPIRDTSIVSDKDVFRELGLLDTIGYLDFQNSEALVKSLQARLPIAAIPSPRAELNMESPLYVIKGPYLTEGDVRILSILKKSAVRFRTFDVAETPRLSLLEARRQVESSVALVAHLLTPARAGALAHNARCALLAGVAMATGKTVLLLQEGDVAQPIDYRDVVIPYRSLEQIPRVLENFLRGVISRLQDRHLKTRPAPERFLERVDLGDVAAENEITGLRSYFVRTAQFTEAKRGLARLVTGRKGSGKTAIFYAVRDSIPRTPGHLVLDLKPEGHQFTTLREAVLAKLSPGLQEHTLVAFWNYILLCELAQKIRDCDYTWAQRDPVRRERFQKIVDVYGQQVSADAGDFSERLLRQVDSLAERFGRDPNAGKLTGSEVTALLFREDIRSLDEALGPYLEEKQSVWILVDNLDKGWPTRGAGASDILLLRALLEATRKLQRQLESRGVELHSLVFLRNDIHDHLVAETPDRGKDTAIVLDWDDLEVFKELIRQRVRASIGGNSPFGELWPQLFTTNVGAQDSFFWIVERTLMRPRDLLTFVNRAIGVAINRRHDLVKEEDLLKAEETYSEDMLLNTAWELRDVYPSMIDVLYHFDRKSPVLAPAEVSSIVSQATQGLTNVADIITLLVWYGFLGVLEDGADEPRFSFQVRYNVDKLTTPVKRGQARYYVHPGFHRALAIRS